MAKNIPLSTIGVKVSYAKETVAGTRPVAGYKVIKGLFSTPDFNVAPNTADVTSFDNVEYTSKIALLKEMPDTIEFGARFGQEFANGWNALMTEYSTAQSSKLEIWFCIDIPGYDKSIYFTGRPIKMGLPAMEQNSAIDTTVYVAPTSEPEYEADPEYAKEV